MSAQLIIGIVFTLVGFLLAAIALFIWLRTQSFLNTAQEAQGTVVQMVYSHSSDGGGGYAPVFTFRTITGQEITASENLYSNPPQFKVGQTVTVLYDPENPNRARIKKGFNLYFVPVLLGFLGLIFGCIGVIFLGIQIYKFFT